jgi:hypothetical protein
VIVKPRLHFALVFAEAQDDAKLIGLDAEEAGKTPQRHGDERNQRNAAAAEISRQKTTQLVLRAAEEFFQIRRTRALLLRT